MAWGDPNVTIKRELSNGVSTPGAAGAPNIVQIQRSGILRSLRHVLDGTATVTLGGGTAAADNLAPWNLMTLNTIVPNDGAPVRNHSGIMGYADMIARSTEGDANTPDTVAVSEGSADPLADVFALPAATGDFRYYMDLPLTQYIRSIDDELGFWPLDNPQVQLTDNYTMIGNTAASPFSIASTTATLGVYLVTGAATVTLAPTIDIRRELFQVPVNEQDEPDLNFVVVTTESGPQGVNVNGAQNAVWKATNNSGILLRLSALIIDGAALLAESKLTNSNSLNLKYGADENKSNETGQAAHARMHKLYGFSPMKGLYIYDFLGKELSLQDTVNLTTMPEFRWEFNFSSALGGANSSIKVLQERLVPISRRSAR